MIPNPRSLTWRRLLPGAAALAVAATAVATAPAASAATTRLPGYSPDVRSAAVHSLVSHRGLSHADAVEVLRSQPRSVRTLDRVTDVLGDRQAGGFLDTRGRPVVTVLDATAAKRVRHAGAVAEHVEHSTAELTTARRVLEAVPAVPDTAVGKDVRGNQIVLTVGDAPKGTALRRLLATADGLGDAVRVRHVAGTMEPAVYGGDAITGGGYRCSAGFNANKGGTDYIVDAGHCTADVSQWDVGPSVDSHFPGSDFGLIRNTSGSAPGAVDLYNGSTQQISSAANPTQGEQVCKSGSTTGLTCGSVVATGVTVNYQQGAVTGLAESTARVGSGDSGGPWFDGSTGLGMSSGMGGGHSYFQPLPEALSSYGVSLN